VNAESRTELMGAQFRSFSFLLPPEISKTDIRIARWWGDGEWYNHGGWAEPHSMCECEGGSLTDWIMEPEYKWLDKMTSYGVAINCWLLVPRGSSVRLAGFRTRSRRISDSWAIPPTAPSGDTASGGCGNPGEWLEPPSPVSKAPRVATPPERHPRFRTPVTFYL